MSDYYIVSLKDRDIRRDYVTVWRPNCAGYAFPLEWAGRYSKDEIDKMPSYYNNGETTMAVPCHVLDSLATPPAPGDVDDDNTLVVVMNKANWRRIKANRLIA